MEELYICGSKKKSDPKLEGMSARKSKSHHRRTITPLILLSLAEEGGRRYELT